MLSGRIAVSAGPGAARAVSSALVRVLAPGVPKKPIRPPIWAGSAESWDHTLLSSAAAVSSARTPFPPRAISLGIDMRRVRRAQAPRHCRFPPHPPGCQSGGLSQEAFCWRAFTPCVNFCTLHGPVYQTPGPLRTVRESLLSPLHGLSLLSLLLLVLCLRFSCRLAVLLSLPLCRRAFPAVLLPCCSCRSGGCPGIAKGNACWGGGFPQTRFHDGEYHRN